MSRHSAKRHRWQHDDAINLLNRARRMKTPLGKTSFPIAIFIISLGYIGVASAAGFQITPTVNGTSRLLAGNGVSGEELGDMFYNPAGLTMYPERSCEVGAIVLTSENEFVNRGSSLNIASPSGPVSIPSSGTANSSEDHGFIPSAFCNLNHKERSRYYFAIGVTSPFGLSTTYPDGWVGRYHAVESELIAIDVNPAVAFEINERLSLGGGISIQYADVTLSQAVFLGFDAPDGFAKITGDDVSPGFNAGVMFKSNSDTTRLGISFRSKVKHTFSGERTVSGTGVFDGRVGAKASVELPETVLFSGYKKLGREKKWGIAAGARWTNWSRFKETRIEFVDGSPDAVTPQNWSDSWTLSVAVDYNPSPVWTFKFAVGFDDSPVLDEFRNPRIPGTDRTIVGVGTTLRPPSWSRWSFEFAYHRTMTDERSIDNTITVAPNITDRLAGEYTEEDTDVFGVQARFRF